MKTFFVTLAVVSLALIIGCQENLLNEPGSEISLDKTATHTNRNMIKLCCQVQDPFSGNCNLNGCVTYVHQIINRAMDRTGLYEISLRIEMDSKLCSMLGMLVHPEWRVQGKSDDIVYVSEEGILLVEKTYWITNRNDVVLLVQYLVTTDGVGISSITLVPIEK